MYKLHCKQLGADCEHPDHEVTGQTKEEVWEKMMEIGKRDHSDAMANMDEAALGGMKTKAWEVMSAQDSSEEAPAVAAPENGDDTNQEGSGMPPAEDQN